MAEYYFTPSDKEHPTVEERELLLRSLYLDVHFLFPPYNMLNYANLISPEEDLEELKEKILVNGRHLSQMIHALSSLDQEMCPTEKELSEVLNGMLPVGHLSFSYEGPSPLPINNFGNIVYFNTFNLMARAYHSRSWMSKSNPSLTITAAPVHLDTHQFSYLGRNTARYQEKDPFVRVSLSDNFREYSREELDQQFHIVPSDYPHIGLSLSDLVCHRLHGFMHAESEVGKGSTFSLYFPQYRKE